MGTGGRVTGATILAASPKALWYLTRGSGVVTLLVFTLAMALGMITSIGWTPKRLPLAVPVALHRNVSMLSVVFLGIHVSTTVLDSYVHITWIDALIPFIGSYHPLALGLGALAVDLLIAVLLTSVLRARMSLDSWRFMHRFAYVCWPIAILHGFLIGTDRHEGWMLSIDAICVALIGVLAVLRLIRRAPRVDGRLQPVAVRSPAPASVRSVAGSRS